MYPDEIRDAIAEALSGDAVLIACRYESDVDNSFREVRDKLMECNVIHETMYTWYSRTIFIEGGKIFFRQIESTRGLQTDRVIFVREPTEREREITAPVVMACKSRSNKEKAMTDKAHRICGNCKLWDRLEEQVGNIPDGECHKNPPQVSIAAENTMLASVTLMSWLPCG